MVAVMSFPILLHKHENFCCWKSFITCGATAGRPMAAFHHVRQFAILIF